MTSMYEIHNNNLLISVQTMDPVLKALSSIASCVRVMHVNHDVAKMWYFQTHAKPLPYSVIILL